MPQRSIHIKIQREKALRLKRYCLGLLMLAGVPVCGAQVTAVLLPDAPSALVQAQKQADDALMGTIAGVVTDTDHAVVSGATVTLTLGAGTAGAGTAGAGTAAVRTRTTVSDGDGEFVFDHVLGGTFSITAKAAGLAAGTETGTLAAGQHFELQELELTVASVETSVNAMSLHDEAEMEVGVEEHQRLLGIVPNFYVVYNWDAAPLSTKQKYKLALHNVLDPVNTGISAAVAGYQYVENDFNGYGRGPAGYFSRFAANEGDLIVGTFVGGAILPGLLHQDPRYFYMGRGTVLHRLGYALASAVICKGDNGKWQPNYSSIGGDVAAGAIANAYYPASDKDGASIIIEQGIIGALADGLSNVVQEFLLKKVTAHAPQYSSTQPTPKVVKPVTAP